MATVDPETLLADSMKTSLRSGIYLSTLIHLVLIGLTSFGLYRSWIKWGLVSDKGFNTPNVIKQLEKEAAKAAEKKAREEKETSEPVAEKAPVTAPVTKTADEKPKLTPLDKQVEDPPKSFDLNGIDL